MVISVSLGLALQATLIQSSSTYQLSKVSANQVYASLVDLYAAKVNEYGMAQFKDYVLWKDIGKNSLHWVTKGEKSKEDSTSLAQLIGQLDNAPRRINLLVTIYSPYFDRTWNSTFEVSTGSKIVFSDEAFGFALTVRPMAMGSEATKAIVELKSGVAKYEELDLGRSEATERSTFLLEQPLNKENITWLNQVKFNYKTATRKELDPMKYEYRVWLMPPATPAAQPNDR